MHNPALFEEIRDALSDEPCGGYTTDITLRDLFAMQAMQAVVNALMSHEAGTKAFKDLGIGQVAETAYEIADALLAERARGK